VSDEPGLPVGHAPVGPSRGSAPGGLLHPPGRRLLVAVVLAVVAALLLLAGLVDGSGGSAPGAARPTGGTPSSTTPSGTEDRAAAARQARTSAIVALLEQRAAALVRDDRAAFLATVDPQSGAFRARQSSWFTNLAAVPLGDWTYEISAADAVGLPAERRRMLGPEAFASPVRFGYRIAGYDRVPVQGAQYLTFVRRDGRWLVADDADGKRVGLTADPQIWDIGRVVVVRGRRSIVLGLQSERALRRLAAEADRGVPRVSAVWGDAWPGRVVLVATRTDVEMARLLGGKPSQYSQLAAVTRGEVGATPEDAAADRVMVNPEAFGRLSADGRRVVLTHEITHVAARADTKPWTPKWLSEGFADYVGYRGAGLAPAAIAQELASDGRRARWPRALPDDARFANSNASLPQAYEMSWLACQLIAERYGERRLVRFYHAVAGEPDGADQAQVLDRAFRDTLGLSTAEFVAQWRAYVRRQLR